MLLSQNLIPCSLTFCSFNPYLLFNFLIILVENGYLCKSGSLVQSNILNIDSAFEVDEITKLQQRPVREELIG